MVPFADYQELVRELVSLKRDGFVPSAPVGEVPVAPSLPQVVQAAITELGVDGATQRQLTKTAWELLRGGVAEDQVAKRITDGEEVTL